MKIGVFFSDLHNKVGDNVDVLPLINPLGTTHEVYTFSKNNNKNLINNSLSYSGNIFTLICKIFSLRKELDILHVFCGLKWSVPLVIFVANICKIKVVYSPLGQLLPNFTQNKNIFKIVIVKIVFKIVLRSNIQIHCCSDFESKTINKWISNKNRFFIVPLAPNIGQQTELNNNNGKYILYFGRFDVWQKGLDIVISSVKIIENHLIDSGLKVVLAGRGSDLQLQKVRKLIKSNGLSELISLRVNVSNAERVSLYKNAKFFYHPSRIEGFARSMRDAIAFQIPIISTFDSNTGNLFSSFNIGWICDFDVTELSKKLITATQINSQEYEEFRVGLKKLFELNNSLNYRDQLYKNYHEIINRS